MADYIIITDREELKTLLRELIAEILPLKPDKPESDYINVEGLTDLLSENGYPISKTQIYKFTSSNTIPHMKVGNKLLFSRSDIFEWIETHKRTPKRTRNPIKTIQANMRKDSEK